MVQSYQVDWSQGTLLIFRADILKLLVLAMAEYTRSPVSLDSTLASIAQPCVLIYPTLPCVLHFLNGRSILLFFAGHIVSFSSAAVQFSMSSFSHRSRTSLLDFQTAYHFPLRLVLLLFPIFPYFQTLVPAPGFLHRLHRLILGAALRYFHFQPSLSTPGSLPSRHCLPLAPRSWTSCHYRNAVTSRNASSIRQKFQNSKGVEDFVLFPTKTSMILFLYHRKSTTGAFRVGVACRCGSAINLDAVKSPLICG